MDNLTGDDEISEFCFDFVNADLSVYEEFEENPDMVKAWKVLFDPDIPASIRTSTDNLSFVSDYLGRFPNEANKITNGVKNASEKQNWLDLFKFEDIALKTGLVNEGAFFTLMEHIPWAKKFTQDFINELQLRRSEVGDAFGRFDLIEFEYTPGSTTFATVSGLPIGNGVYQMTLEINLNWLNDFQDSTYADLQNSLKADGEAGTFVHKSVQDVVNHEFGHLLTELQAMNGAAQNVYDNGSPDFFAALYDISDYCTFGSNDDASEALAEIYAAHKQDRVIPLILKNFFNQFSPHYPI